ncbi:flagellar assembly protein FliW [Lysinibacillus endophyticus]|uniref:flagellar assembly protein FliW n=1 Tax=Ureibacillus endophyticus TaxID=1978490 RepID=UPI00209FBE18|nr:flagellar assembly protein FliW [Lysinibacillus endophyticus]MCP1143738.1 flagellar assembly protein FliW [Lysinibacillus endophyticus]
MKIKTAYMGEITIDPNEILHFAHGIPGFEEEDKFILLPLEENSAFQILQSIRTEQLAFIITSPYIVVSDYTFDIDQATIKALDIQNENEVAVFAIISLKDSLENSTVNLKAPIVFNTTNKKAKQVILEKENYGIRHKFHFESVKG